MAKEIITTKDSEDFNYDVLVQEDSLIKACNWIGENLDIDQVFDEETIRTYCMTHGWTKF